MIPEASDLGPGWSLIDDATITTDLAEPLRDAANAQFGGPNGARAHVAVLLMDEGMSAVRDSWELANGIFDNYGATFDDDFDSDREDQVANNPLPAGCADARRTFGTDEFFADAFEVGITLCAADPDAIVLAYASGEVNGLSGWQASDALVALVLSQTATATPESG